MLNKEINYFIDNEMGGGGVVGGVFLKVIIKICKIVKCIYIYFKKCIFKNVKMNYICVIDNFIFIEFKYLKN